MALLFAGKVAYFFAGIGSTSAQKKRPHQRKPQNQDKASHYCSNKFDNPPSSEPSPLLEPPTEGA